MSGRCYGEAAATRYIPTGHLVYALGDALFALAFDLDSLEVSGGPVPVLDGLMRSLVPGQNTGTAHYGISDAGTLVHIGANAATPQQRVLVWRDRTGREEAISAPPRAYSVPRISPDGTQVALDVRDQENDIWIWSLARQTLTRLTFDVGLDRSPVWTPDGRRILFSSQRAGGMTVFWQAADGTGAAERLSETAMNAPGPTSISADGRQIVFDNAAPGNVDVRMITLGEKRKTTPLIATMYNERSADLSRDGQWVAYESSESGETEVYVRPFPNVDGGRWQVSAGGGSAPLWAPDGRELFYVDAEERVVALPIQPGPGFVAGNPRVVVDGPYVTGVIPGRMYDISPDGRRFVDQGRRPRRRDAATGADHRDPELVRRVAEACAPERSVISKKCEV